MTTMLVQTLVSLGVLAVIFVPLERTFPARPGQALWRRELVTDLAFFAGQYLVFASIVVVCLSAISPWLPRLELALPLWLQVIVAVVAGDLVMYWFHRACHHFPWLWRFHAVHHSAEELDWVAAHREHPLDGLLTQLCVNLPAIVLGLPFAALGGLIAFRGLWAIFIHANLQVPVGPLRYLFGAPELHHWHHARTTGPVHNFANLAPYLDLLFGTYHRPSGPETYPLGLVEPWPRRYLAQLVWPLRRQRRR